MPRRGRKRKKTRTHVSDNETAASSLKTSEETKIPKSLVIRRGKCEAVVADLVHDVRKVMMPYTAVNFKEDASYRKLTIQKYCQHACLPLGVSHMLVFSQNEERLALRIAKTPQGPTLTFRVHQFSLAKHIQKLQRRPVNTNSLTDHSPIVVTNNFGDVSAPPQVKLMRITFQNMFPAINVATVRLKECRRVILFHMIEDEAEEDGGETRQRVEVRHYAIKATPVGVNKKVRRLIQTKIPNLNKVQDIADYIAGTANASTNVDLASDSEPEDGNAAVVELAQNYVGRGNKSQSKSALKLVELGPRLSLQLIKVEQGLGDGNVMYHALVHKSPEEAKAIQKKAEDKVLVKKQRRDEQERNVERKQKVKEDKRQAKKQRKEEREKSALEELRHKETKQDSDDDDGGEDDDDDDNSDDDNNDDLENEDLGVSDIEDDSDDENDDDDDE